MTKVLVTYATKYRSTAEIADVIGDALHQSGLDVEIFPASEVKDVAAYDAVVLGSAIYAGNWLSEATTFLKQFVDDLAMRDVWLFSSGPAGEGDPKALLNGWVYPPPLEKIIEQIKPLEIVVFHGNVDVSALSYGERLIVRMVKSPTGDFRDWQMIGDWSRHIVEVLQQQKTLIPG